MTKMASFQMRIMAGVLPFLLAAPAVALAQTQPLPYRGTAVTRTTTETVYTRQQIDQLIAPIALYPDPLLTHVLMAATYPQQIIEAAQWVQDPAHAALRGEELVEALRPLPWAPSVKALVAVPQVIFMLSEHIEWTQALGIAVVAQQPLVLTRVQALRHLAVRSGRLRHVRHLDVHVRNDIIVITSAEPERVVVPVYNPVVVYGEWPDRDYPPVYIPPPPSLRAQTVERGFWVSPGYAVAAPLWSWSRPDWRDRSIDIDRSAVARITRNYESGSGNVWRHQGRVVLVAPLTARRENNRTASQVAGTVAPAGAAAVVSLPQRAERLPNLIETPRTAQRPGMENRTVNEGRGFRPGERPRGPQGQQERMTGQQMPATPENRPATAEQRGTSGFGMTRPGGNAANAGRAPAEQRSGEPGSLSEHNRGQAATGQAAGTSAGMQNRPEHHRGSVTNESAGQQGGAGGSSQTGTNRTTTESTGRHGATAGAEHNRNRTATESAGQQTAPSSGAANTTEHHRNEAATTGRQTPANTSHRNHHEATTNERNETAGRHAGAAHPAEHNRTETPTHRPVGQQGAATGSTVNEPAHHRGSGTTEAAGRHGATATAAGAANRLEHRGGAATNHGAEHRHNQAATGRSHETMPGSQGHAGERAGASTQHAGRHETAGKGASAPGAAPSHGAATHQMRGSSGEAAAGASEPPGREAHGH